MHLDVSFHQISTSNKNTLHDEMPQLIHFLSVFLKL